MDWLAEAHRELELWRATPWWRPLRRAKHRNAWLVAVGALERQEIARAYSKPGDRRPHLRGES